MTTQNLYSHHNGQDLTIQHIEGGLPEPDVERPVLSQGRPHTITFRPFPGRISFARSRRHTQELCDMTTKGIQSTDYILEVGCVSSRRKLSLFGLALRRAKVVGMDMCDRKRGAARPGQAHSSQCVAYMPFPDESFDLVFLWNIWR